MQAPHLSSIRCASSNKIDVIILHGGSELVVLYSSFTSHVCLFPFQMLTLSDLFALHCLRGLKPPAST